MFHKMKCLVAAAVFTGCCSTAIFAQDELSQNKEDFKYIGVNLMASTPTNGTYDGTKVSAGIEGVYLKKVSESFSLGFSGSYGLWKTIKDDDFQPAQNMSPAYYASSTRPYQRYNLSLLMGLIIDHESDARSIFTFGPTYDANIAKISITRDFGENPVPDDPWLAEKYEIDKNDRYYGVTFGYYHERPSRLTYGVVGTGGMSDFSSLNFYATIRATAGYSF